MVDDGRGRDRRHGHEASARLDELNAAQVATVLGLVPHREGGYFRETYRSPVGVPTPAGIRSLSTSILYLLTGSDPSRLHRLRFDELWFFHAGSRVEMVFLDPLETHVVGPEAPQALAPGGRWMGARIVPAPVDGEAERDSVEIRPVPEGGPQTGPGPESPWALVGCVVSPGFEYDDFEAGQREDLLQTYPEAADFIRVLS